MKKNQTIIIILVTIIALLVGGIAGYALANVQHPTTSSSNVNNSSEIDSFQECADAGNAIQQTYPETCSVPGGKTFTNN